MNTADYIRQLENRVRQIQTSVETWRTTLSLEQLRQTPSQGGWCALQCLDHLNKYAEMYLPALENAVKKTSGLTPPAKVLHGWLGKKFTQMLSPTPSKPMKTVSQLEASKEPLGIEVLDQFVVLQARILTMLAASKQSDINRRRIPFALFKPVKLRTSDVLNFLIGHEERHLAQAQRAISSFRNGVAIPVLMV